MISYIESKKIDDIDIAFIEAPLVSSSRNASFIDLSDNYSIVQKNRLIEYAGVTEPGTGFIRLHLDKQEYPFLRNLLNITNAQADGAPLFYKYKIKNPVTRYIITERQFFVYDAVTNTDTIVNPTGLAADFNYRLYPFHLHGDVYELYIFFDKAPHVFEKYFVYYIDANGNEHKEFLYPEFGYYYSADADRPFEYCLREGRGESIIIINTPIPDEKIFIDFTGYNKIFIKEIPEEGRHSGWGPSHGWGVRIKNGHFEINNMNEARLKFIYNLREFDEQTFNAAHGAPYMDITESPDFLEDKLFLSRPLLSNRAEIKVFINAELFWTDKDINSIDRINGIIKLPKKISPKSRVDVSYTAIVDFISYSGYYDFNWRRRLVFNLNPTYGNKMSYVGALGGIVEKPAFNIMNRPVYIYLKPSYIYYADKIVNDEPVNYYNILDAVNVTADISYNVCPLGNPAFTGGFCELKKMLGNFPIPRKANNYLEAGAVYWTFDNDNTNVNTAIRVYNTHLLRGQQILFTYVLSDQMQLAYLNNTSSVFHTMDKIDPDEALNNGYLLLGEAFCFPNSIISDLNITDLRRRGGGVIEALKDAVRREIEPESDYYWDIGFWDGEEFSDLALCFRLDRRILKQYGGTITEDQILAAINKHVALGTDIKIEYLEIDAHIGVRTGN